MFKIFVCVCVKKKKRILIHFAGLGVRVSRAGERSRLIRTLYHCNSNTATIMLRHAAHHFSPFIPLARVSWRGAPPVIRDWRETLAPIAGSTLSTSILNVHLLDGSTRVLVSKRACCAHHR